MSKETIDLQPAPTEVLDEFERVRERFLTEFDRADHPSIKTTEAYLAQRGLHMHPTVTVPYDPVGFSAARAIASESKYPLPFIYKRFSKDKDFSVINGAGTAFSTPAYRLNVIQDISGRAAEAWGEEYADRITSTTFAHEVAHSVFHKDPVILIREQGGNKAIYERYPLSGMLHRVYDDAKTIGPHMPNWAEEAFAVHVAADVFKPETGDQDGHVMYFEVFGDDEFWLDSHYLAYAPQWPDYPGSIDGAIAGQSLEVLETKLPGTIEAMFDIATESADPEEWRAQLRKKVGRKLFGMMFMRHPYKTWTTIHQSINDLRI